MSNTATYISDDTTTMGSWTGVYGADGWQMAQYLAGNGLTSVNDDFSNESTANVPGYASITLNNENVFVWDSDNSNPDVRKLRRPSGSNPIAACWYTGVDPWSMTISVGSSPKYVTLYLLDWESSERSTDITVKDADNGVTLISARNYAGTNYENGVWVRYSITGNITFEFAWLGGPNATVSMVSFDPVGSLPAFQAAGFLAF